MWPLGSLTCPTPRVRSIWLGRANTRSHFSLTTLVTRKSCRLTDNTMILASPRHLFSKAPHTVICIDLWLTVFLVERIVRIFWPNSNSFFIWYMVDWIKVNLGYWFALHLRTVLSKKNKPLILGSFITQLVGNLGVLDLNNHNLHWAYTMEPLDLIFFWKRWT